MKSNFNNEPHAQRENAEILSKNVGFCRQGWLKNGNPPGDLTKALRCNASSKRTGFPCRQPAMANGKCRLHGGKSTGPRTPQGLARSRKSNWKHGEYSRESKEEFKAFRQGLKLFLNPQAVFKMSPAELRMHENALERLMDKMQHGFLTPYRQVRR